MATDSSPSQLGDLPWCLLQCSEHPQHDHRPIPQRARFTKDKRKVWCVKCYDHARGQGVPTDEQLLELWDVVGNPMPARADALLPHLKKCDKQTDGVRAEASRRLEASNERRRANAKQKKESNRGSATSGASASSSAAINHNQEADGHAEAPSTRSATAVAIPSGNWQAPNPACAGLNTAWTPTPPYGFMSTVSATHGATVSNPGPSQSQQLSQSINWASLRAVGPHYDTGTASVRGTNPLVPDGIAQPPSASDDPMGWSGYH